MTFDNISRNQGDDYPIEVEIFNGDTAYDLTNVSQATLAVSDNKSGPPLCQMPGAIVDAAAGKLKFEVAGIADVLKADVYYAEIQLIDADYTVTTDQFQYKVNSGLFTQT